MHCIKQPWLPLYRIDALDWLAAMTTHIPDQGEQMVRYYRFYNNVSRGLRQKENQDALIPSVIEAGENAKPNRNLARLIQKKYEVDPLTCLKCQGLMRIPSFLFMMKSLIRILGFPRIAQPFETRKNQDA